MASVNIRRRAVKSGFRFIVRYRLGGRETPLLHAGSFRTLDQAEAHQDWLRRQIAAGRLPDRAAPSRTGEAFVYIARLGDLFKIGISIAPKERARDLNAELLHVESGGRIRERELHNAFKHARLSGEWFRDDERIRRYLERRSTEREAMPSNREKAS